MKRPIPPLLFDGAMGTYYASTYGDDMPCELAALRHPSRIADIHEQYLRAGAMAIRTDTFRADACSLGIGPDEILRLVDAAWQAAKDAAGSVDRIWASFGPPVTQGQDIGCCGEEATALHNGPSDPELEMIRKIDRFLSIGARNFVFETFEDETLPLRMCEHIRRQDPTAGTQISFAVSPDGLTHIGRFGTDLVRTAMRHPDVDHAGFNCVSGPIHLLHRVQDLVDRQEPEKPLVVMPNAGYPSQIGGRTVYRDNPEYFADTMVRIGQAGVQILGGCCGTTPKHIAALAGCLTRTGAVVEQPTEPVRIEVRPPAKPPVEADKSHGGFRDLLHSGRKVLAAELDPPTSADPTRTVTHAAAYCDAGTDLITVADNPLGWSCADVSVTSAQVKRLCRADVLPHLACRDRNLSAIRSQLLALHIEGIRQVLVVTGDPVPADLASDIRGVFHLHATQLIAYIRNLNHSLFADDGFLIGAALNLGASKFDVELERAERKIRQGADFFITQPVFGTVGLDRLAQAHTTLSRPLIAGILPVVSHRNALFLNNEVHGIEIPADMVRAFEGLRPPESVDTGVALALETIRAARPHASGFHLITPLRKTGVVADILRGIVHEIRQGEHTS